MVLELVGESAGEFDLEDSVLGLNETAELAGERDLIDLCTGLVELGGRILESGADTHVQLGPLRSSYKGDPWSLRDVRITKKIEVGWLRRTDRRVVRVGAGDHFREQLEVFDCTGKEANVVE